MRIWDVPYQLQILKSSGPERTGGVHVSDIIRNLALRGGMLDRKWANKIRCGCGTIFDELTITSHRCDRSHLAARVDDMSPEHIELGVAWEERLPKHHPEICFHPGELDTKGIKMTIDGASYRDEAVTIFHPGEFDGALHEFKLTWKSSRKDFAEHWMWLTQMKCYIYGMWAVGMLITRVAYAHIYWVNGNYARDPMDPESGPRYRIKGLEFSQLEIRENWDMIEAHNERMLIAAEKN